MRVKGSGSINALGYICMGGKDKNDKKFLHVIIAEKVLGRPLPRKAVIHHVDKNPQNNAHDNLVICPNQSYHFLLHARMRAVESGYPPHFMKCAYCKSYDDPAAMYLRPTSYQAWHRSCAQARKK